MFADRAHTCPSNPLLAQAPAQQGQGHFEGSHAASPAHTAVKTLHFMSYFALAFFLTFHDIPISAEAKICAYWTLAAIAAVERFGEHMCLLFARHLIMVVLMLGIAGALLRDHDREQLIASNPTIAVLRAPKSDDLPPHVAH